DEDVGAGLGHRVTEVVRRLDVLLEPELPRFLRRDCEVEAGPAPLGGNVRPSLILDRNDRRNRARGVPGCEVHRQRVTPRVNPLPAGGTMATPRLGQLWGLRADKTQSASDMMMRAL